MKEIEIKTDQEKELIQEKYITKTKELLKLLGINYYDKHIDKWFHYKFREMIKELLYDIGFYKLLQIIKDGGF